MAKTPAKPKTAWLPAFLYFLSLIKISSKDFTEPGPITLYKAQQIALEQICEGIENGQFHQVCLKARQLGISTVLLALDIFWLYMHPGLRGALIFDNEPNREIARQTIVEMLESLPNGFKIGVKKHNRTMLALNNGSVLQYMSAGKGKNGGLGRSRAVSYVHASEISSWGDQKGIDSLMKALSAENPNRLYIFESTALGFNVFNDLWNRAQAMPDQKAFFIGWWAKDSYRWKRGTREYEKWWGDYPQFTDEEIEKIAIVKDRYAFDVDEEQVAWYRAQQFEASDASVAEELPWHEDEAFQASGSPFFSQKRLTEDMNFLENARVSFNGFKYTFGDKFFSMKIDRHESIDGLDLRVWEEPKPHGRYIIGIDPAYGRSSEADRSVLSVWRCYADMLVQVAEFATPYPETRETAWVMAHLAGVYRDCMWNLEINGPGAQVMMELKSLRMQMAFGDLREPAAALGQAHCLDNARWFLWKKADTLTAGASAFNFSTNHNTKTAGLNKMRDHYNSNRLVVRSRPLLEEMMTLQQDGDSIGASGRNKDDRVMAGMLACYGWDEWIRIGMTANEQTFARENQKDQDLAQAGDAGVVENIVQNFFKQQARQRSDAELRILLGGRV